jgi:hypothetical protein
MYVLSAQQVGHALEGVELVHVQQQCGHQITHSLGTTHEDIKQEADRA